MIIFIKAEDISHYVEHQRKNGVKIGFVPTMGSLHEGHMSLINKSNTEHEITICSIFVNPTQFNNSNDFNTYPKNIEADIKLLEFANCDVLFLPENEEIYPAHFEKKYYDLGYLDQILEGKFRPGHFQGVCMVVERLLNIIQCDTLYLGQKDYQQCMVIQKLLSLMQSPIKLQIEPTVREKSGLAMSSRNKRLAKEEAILALEIYNTLLFIKENIKDQSLDTLKNNATATLSAKGFTVDYIEITDRFLHPVLSLDTHTQFVVLVAATINTVRLIDNMIG